MPIYEYSCKKCGQTIEVIQKITDPELKKHKGCGGALTKLISAAGFQFKGTGWYVTDYARKGDASGDGSKGSHESATKSESASNEGKTADKSDSGKSSDSTPAAKKESSKQSAGKS